MVCKEFKVEPQLEETTVEMRELAAATTEDESSRNNLGCTYSHRVEEQTSAEDPKGMEKRHSTELSIKRELNESPCLDNLESGMEETACICSIADLEGKDRPSSPCRLCPLWHLEAEQDAESCSPAEVAGITLLVKITGLALNQPPEYVKIFEPQDEETVDSPPKIIANGIICCVLSNNLLFLTVNKKYMENQSKLSVKKGDLVGVCQRSTKEMFNKYKAVKNIPEELDAFVCTPEKEIVLTPDTTTIVKLRITTVDANTDIHKPLIGFRRFSRMVKQWKDIKIMSKRISVQSRKFAFLPVRNSSNAAIKLSTGTKFGTFSSIESLDFFTLRVKTEKSMMQRSTVTIESKQSEQQNIKKSNCLSESNGYSCCIYSPSSSMLSPLSDVSPKIIKYENDNQLALNCPKLQAVSVADCQQV